LDKKINIVVDFNRVELDVDLLEALVGYNTTSFPDYLGTIFVIGVNIMDYARDSFLVDRLNKPEIKRYCKFMTTESYPTLLYADIQEATALDSYFGALSAEIIDLRPMIIESLITSSILS
jgi:hypothetical protein